MYIDTCVVGCFSFHGHGIKVTTITGIGIFRTGSLTAQRGNSTLSENSTLTSRPHSARPDARRDTRLRTAAPGGVALRKTRFARSRLCLLSWESVSSKRAKTRRNDVFRLAAIKKLKVTVCRVLAFRLLVCCRQSVVKSDFLSLIYLAFPCSLPIN